MGIWYLYILDCDGAAFYTGITTDLQRRLREHRSGKPPGAQFTQRCQSIQVVYSLQVGSRSLAMRLERRVKGLSRPQKLRLVASQPDLESLLVRLNLA